ncbi:MULTISPECIES: 16S rRNA (cytosine(967)-C(5))-methyltransferase RsmB [Bacillaceae]|uniref:16S rRNA (cytosine(967)-C(5))-methyltransferase n=1 Tax=Evansella alkalicola TaxID=745819 RepID=A0ABS6JPN6_9BACI|nr:MULTISPECIES: 16S rRNA (cytosine(967)-C(5))-methyltransferase RsmB [Bacillaceae]MBU9720400.1 16S rRNA (cytosine(967)-C(5))-methyltransferase RsmB [Bacillus alkalicola]
MKQGNVREAVLDLLLKIEKNQAYSNLLINDTIKKSQLNPKDIPLLTELVYGTLQHQRTLDFYLQHFSKRPLGKLDTWVHILLRFTLYQMVYLDRIPDRAAIHEAVQISKKRGHQGISGMINGILRSIQREGIPKTEKIKDADERLAIETSHPDWMISRWIKQFGKEKTEAIAKANLTHPIHSARVNRTKTTVDEVLQSLEQAGIDAEKSKQVPESITISKGSLAGTSAFSDGLITIQDEGSMLVAHIMSPQKGETILDACAAPGGKSTHIAEMMENTGEVVSLDIHKHKVGLIDQQVKRLGLKNIHTEVMDARHAGKKFEAESFDRILIDAPCSGLGVIQRKPDLKWTKSADDVKRLSQIQLAILDAVWPLLKQGGRLVYSTCTVDMEENHEVISTFINNNDDSKLDKDMYKRLPDAFLNCSGLKPGMLQLFPGEKGTDGFFISSVCKTIKGGS